LHTRREGKKNLGAACVPDKRGSLKLTQLKIPSITLLLLSVVELFRLHSLH